MANGEQQNFKKHARWLPAYHFFVIPVLLANVILTVWRAIQVPTLGTLFSIVFAAALLLLGLLSRTQTLTVQDRVIRLEMRLRLRQLLPPDLLPHIDSLTHRQLVALRFASDAELADLVRDVVAGKLSTTKEIKMRVKSWQADWLRA
jgi:Family of unknown function (DUF6526)